MGNRLTALLLLMPGLLLVACSSNVPHPPCDLNAIVYPETGRPLHNRTQLGVEYATANAPYYLAPALAVTRARLAKISDVRWGDIAPNPPADGDPGYQWNLSNVRLDDRVKAYQQAGFDLMIELRARSSWGQAVWPTDSPVAASRPKPEHESAYQDWVQAVVERYDGDGVNDLPGLLRPMRTYEIESEAQHWVYWQGVTNESWTRDYLDTLRLAAAGARAADSRVQIILTGIGGGAVFDGFPTADELRALLTGFDPQVRDALCGGILFVQEVIQARDAYDLIEFHALSDYTGLYAETTWLAGLLDHYGLPETPIWAGDATSAPNLTGDPQALKVHPLYPEHGEELFRILDTPGDPQHAEVEVWYRKEQAELAVKKFVVAAELGMGAIMMGLEQDWAWARNPAFGQRDFAYQGLVEPVQPFQVPDSRPAARSLRMLTDRLTNYTAVERLSLSPQEPGQPATLQGLYGQTNRTRWLPLPLGEGWGEGVSPLSKPGPIEKWGSALTPSLRSGQALTLSQGERERTMSALAPRRRGDGRSGGGRVYAYRFTVNFQPVYVLWYDDGVAQLPWESEPEVTISLPVNVAQVTLSTLITRWEQTEPPQQILTATGGHVTFRLGETPALIEGDRAVASVYLPLVLKSLSRPQFHAPGRSVTQWR